MATKTWVGGVDTNWGTGGNWSPVGAPASGDTAYIPGAAAPDITINVIVSNVTVILTSGTRTLASGIGSFRDDCTFAPVPGSILTVAAAISTAAPGNTLTISGGGIVYLSGSVTSSGDLTVSADATLRVNTAGVLNAFTSLQLGDGIYGAKVESIAGGAVTVTVPVTVTNAVTLLNNSGAAGLFTFSGVISGTGSVIIDGLAGNAVAMSNTNTFTAGVTVASGSVLNITSNRNLGAIPGSPTTVLTLNGGTANFTSSASLDILQLVTVTGSCSVTVGAGVSAGVSRVSGSGSINLSGTGTVLFASASTFTGGITVNAGVTANPAGAGAFGTGTCTLQGGTLGAGGITNAITYFSGTVNTWASYGGVLTIAGGATFTCPAAASPNSTVAVPVGTTFNVNSLAYTGTVQYSGGTVANIGAMTGTVSISAGQTFTYTTAPNAKYTVIGTLDLAAGSRLFRTGSSVQGGTIQNGSLTVQSGVTFQSGTVSAAIIGASVVTKTTSGTLFLGSANTFAGGVDIQAGTVTAGDDAAFGSGTVLLASGASVDFGGYAVANTVTAAGGNLLGGDTYSGIVTVSALATVTIPAANELAGTATVSATGKLAIAGQHTGTINNDGEVEVDDATVTDPPVNTYNGNCGSTYAVRAA